MPADAPRCACPALCACRDAVPAPGDLCPSCGRGFHVMPPMGALLAELAADPEGVAAALDRARLREIGALSNRGEGGL